MSYLPFARKWRPQDFDEVIGQEHITTTLKNAISMDRVHHAYLFTGPRGIGKTSTARILSKALNCEKGPSPKPCNNCLSCDEIARGTSMDVIEIDGASNRGIDEIRNLRETVKFAPSRGRYKLYIIDEVHMLTPEAFNALLKTLEEPPLHVKFIFATTEPHKLPATILSRCQRFNFRRIPVKDIVAKLHEVVKEEKLDIEKDVFLYIAKAADGSMRDAESILDQVSSFSKGKICLNDVVESLGMIAQDVIFRCAEEIINRDAKGAVCLINDLLNSGKDAKQFLFEMLEHFRNIMIAKVGVSSEELIALSKDSIEIIKKHADALSKGDIFYIINVISNSLNMIRKLLPERIVLELCMIKLTSRDSISSIEEILSRLPEEADLTQKSSSNDPVKIEHKAPQESHSPKKPHEAPKHDIKTPEPEKIVSPETSSSLDITRVKDAWPILIKTMAVKKISISSYLAEGEIDFIKKDIIFVAFPKELNLHREVLEGKHNKELIESTLSKIMDAPVNIQFIATDRKLKEPEREDTVIVKKEELKKKEPMIESALNLFGGKILRSTRNT